MYTYTLFKYFIHIMFTNINSSSEKFTSPQRNCCCLVCPQIMFAVLLYFTR